MKLFKRIASFMLALLMMMNLTVTSSAAVTNETLTITTSKSQLTVGEEFSVYLNSSEKIADVASYMIDFPYDDELLEFVGAEFRITSPNTNPSIALTRTDELTGGRNVRLMLEKLSTTAVAEIPAGQFAELKFKTLKEGNFTFKLDNTVEIYGAGFTEIYVPENGAVTAAAEVTVANAPTYTGYGVSMSQDSEVAVGETAKVEVSVSNSDSAVTRYNAYDLTLTYDTEKLSYVGAAAADTDADVQAENGKIRIIGYGADKSFDVAAVSVEFMAKATGTAAVTLTSAKVDASANANVQNAPDAALTDNITYIQVNNYSVILSEGLEGATSVANGEDYTFRAKDAANYNYVISATMGGAPVSVTDNQDGTYTIQNVTGMLVITAQMTPKSYSVTVDPTGTAKDDVTAEPTATYNTAYTFRVSKQSGYTYTVNVTIGGEQFALGTPDNAGNYTIPGTDITGDIVIKADKTETPADMVTVEKPDWVIGEATAEKGKNYSFTIDAENGYSYKDMKVTVAGADITEQLWKSGEYAYTIPGQYVTGNIKIEVTRSADITIAVNEYITLNEKAMYLVTVSGIVEDGKTVMYDGQSMYWSEQYNAYVYLVVSSDSLDALKTEAQTKIAVAEGASAGNVVYTGDVNSTSVIDVNDAQLTYDMYNAKYEAFDTVTMLKFLNADVNGSKNVNVEDAAAVVSAIKAQTN